MRWDGVGRAKCAGGYNLRRYESTEIYCGKFGGWSVYGGCGGEAGEELDLFAHVLLHAQRDAIGAHDVLSAADVSAGGATGGHHDGGGFSPRGWGTGAGFFSRRELTGPSPPGGG